MSANRKTIKAALTLIIMVFLNSTAHSAVVSRKFGGQPLDDVIAAATATTKCPGLTSKELVAMMLVPSWWETVGGSTKVTPSPMTLSRADFGSKNIKLYSEATYATDVRAFLHPGIGLWQIDDSGPIGQPLVAHERINTEISAKPIAEQIAEVYCQTIGTDIYRRKFAWLPWFACRGKNFQRCEQTYKNHYNAKTDSLQHITRDNTVTRLGGMISRACIFDSSPTPNGTFPCYYIDPALAQGHKGSWQGTSGGGANGATPSPLSLPFYSFTDTAPTNEYRLWTVADTTYSGEIFAERGIGTSSRDTTLWTKSSNIKCTLSVNTLKCEPPSLPLQWVGYTPGGLYPGTMNITGLQQNAVDAIAQSCTINGGIIGFYNNDPKIWYCSSEGSPFVGLIPANICLAVNPTIELRKKYPEGLIVPCDINKNPLVNF